MYEKLEQLISEGDYKEALYEFQEEYQNIGLRSDEDASRLCVLEASIWEALGDGIAEFEAIAKGMSFDQTNYELFYMLGLYYQNFNIDKAYLCYEMALFYCDVDSDREVIASTLQELKKDTRVRVRGVSVMVLSYNDLELLKMCIDSVERSLPKESLEIVVVDNASTEEGVREFLRERADSADYSFKLIENSENMGFPVGCNQGADCCNEDNDIFFLNNDAVLTTNALFWLRMGLYENRNVGACSSLSNSASLQEVAPSLLDEYAGEELDNLWHKELGVSKSVEIFSKYAAVNSIPMYYPYIKRFRLTGFALLVSRDALKVVAPDNKVFDEIFSPGYFEDDDLGMRLATASFEQYLCANSFIYHNGGNGFEGHNDAMERSRQTFIDKWGFDIWGFCLHWQEACDKIADLYAERKEPLKILDFSCNFGATGSYLKHMFPDVFVAGVCDNSFAAGIAKNIVDDVVYGNLNTSKLPWNDHSFDVVLFEREKVCKVRASQFVKTSGIIIDDREEERD